MTDDLDLKRCARCAALIPKSATKCAYCDTSEPDKLTTKRPGPPRGVNATRVLIGANLLVFAFTLMVLVRSDPSAPFFHSLVTGSVRAYGEVLGACGAYQHPLVVGRGEWWRVLAATFLHGGAIHLVMNMLALKQLGEFAEHLFGTSKLLVLYVLGGAVSTLATGVWHTAQGHPNLGLVGASGAIFAVLGALSTFLLRRGNDVGRKIGKELAYNALFMIGLGLWFPFVSNAAHVAGLAVGVLFGFLVHDSFSLRISPGSRSVWALAALLACAAAVASLGWAFVSGIHYAGAKG